MLMLSIIFLSSSNAVTLRRDKSILYARIVLTILISCFILCINSYYTDLHLKGLGLFGGLAPTTALVHFFHLFTPLVTGGIMLFNINNKVISESFFKRFKLFIFLLWKNIFNCVLYFSLIYFSFYMLNTNYIILFNFSLNTPFILHLFKLLIFYPIISILSSYMFAYLIIKKDICLDDALKAITFNRFLIITIWYFLGVYLSLNILILTYMKGLLSNIIILVLDLSLQYIKFHSLTANIFKLSNCSVTFNKISKVTVSTSTPNKINYGMYNSKPKFLPKITLNGFYSNSLFNNILYRKPGATVNTFLDKKLYISKPLKLAGLNAKFTIQKLDNHLYSKISLGNHNFIIISTNFKIISWFNNNLYHKSNTYNNSVIVKPFTGYSNDAKDILVRTNIDYKKLEAKNVIVKPAYGYDNSVKDNAISCNIEYNKLATYNVVPVFALTDIVYDNPYLNARNLSYNYHTINELTLVTLKNALPADIQNSAGVINILQSLEVVRIAVNNIKNFLFNSHLLIEIKKGRLELPNNNHIQNLNNVFNNTLNNAIFCYLTNILQYTDPTVLDDLVTWLYVNIGVKYPLVNYMDIYHKAISVASTIEQQPGVDYVQMSKLIFGFSSERVGFSFDSYSKNYHEYSRLQGNFHPLGWEINTGDLTDSLWQYSRERATAMEHVELATDLIKTKLNNSNLDNIESYSLAQLDLKIHPSTLTTNNRALYNRSLLTKSNLISLADTLEERLLVKESGDNGMLFKQLSLDTTEHIKIRSILVTYLLNQEFLYTATGADLNNVIYWKKLYPDYITLNYHYLCINDSFISNLRHYAVQ